MDDSERLPIGYWPTLTTVWVIQMVKNGQKVNGFFNVRAGSWHGWPLIASRFPSQEAAEAFIEEFGLEDIAEPCGYAYDT